MFRGWLVIHAALHRVRMAELGAELVALTHSRGFDRVPYGAIVGAVYLDHCQHIDSILAQYLEETDRDSLVCGNWRNGRYAWRRSHAVPLDEAIAYRGHQGFFKVEESELPATFVARLRELAPF